MPAPVSVRLDDATKTRLEREAALEDRSLSYMTQQAIIKFLDAREQKRRAVAAALAEADAGDFISDEAMTAWVNSWGDDAELPVPAADMHISRS